MDFFKNVRTFSFFLAPSRSGHSVVAHLLSAHPDVMFSDELDALMWFDEGFRADQVYTLIKFQNYRYGKRGRRKSGYSYQVESSWQYQWGKQPQVIGDSKGRQSSRLLASKHSLLEKIRNEVRVELRIFVQARHPYRIVASEMRNRHWSLSAAIGNVIRDIQEIESIVQKTSVLEQRVQYHEDILANPGKSMDQMFNFLDVWPDENVIKLCANKIRTAPKLSRKAFSDRPMQLEELDRAMQDSSIFRRYCEDDQVQLEGLPAQSVLARAKRAILRL